MAFLVRTQNNTQDGDKLEEDTLTIVVLVLVHELVSLNEKRHRENSIGFPCKNISMNERQCKVCFMNEIDFYAENRRCLGSDGLRSIVKF